MAINQMLVRQAIASLAQTTGLYMNAESLVEDVFLLARAFPEQDDFMAACASTKRALELLVAGKVTPSNLKYEFQNWSSYHYQHRAGQGIKATCRIVFRQRPDGIEVKGFGHRHIPADFYRRIAAARLVQEPELQKD